MRTLIVTIAILFLASSGWGYTFGETTAGSHGQDVADTILIDWYTPDSNMTVDTGVFVYGFWWTCSQQVSIYYSSSGDLLATSSEIYVGAGGESWQGGGFSGTVNLTSGTTYGLAVKGSGTGTSLIYMRASQNGHKQLGDTWGSSWPDPWSGGSDDNNYPNDNINIKCSGTVTASGPPNYIHGPDGTGVIHGPDGGSVIH